MDNSRVYFVVLAFVVISRDFVNRFCVDFYSVSLEFVRKNIFFSEFYARPGSCTALLLFTRFFIYFLKYFFFRVSFLCNDRRWCNKTMTGAFAMQRSMPLGSEQTPCDSIHGQCGTVCGVCAAMGRLLCRDQRGISRVCLYHTKRHNGIDLKTHKNEKRNCRLSALCVCVRMRVCRGVHARRVRACAFKCLYKTVALNAVCDDYYYYYRQRRWVGRTLSNLPLYVSLCCVFIACACASGCLSSVWMPLCECVCYVFLTLLYRCVFGSLYWQHRYYRYCFRLVVVAPDGDDDAAVAISTPWMLCCHWLDGGTKRDMLYATDSSKRQTELTFAICYHFERWEFIAAIYAFVLFSTEKAKCQQKKAFELIHLPF